MEKLRSWIEKFGIGRRIDKIGEFLRNWPHIRIVTFICFFIGIIVWGTMIPVTLNLHDQTQAYFDSIGIRYERFEVTMPSRMPMNIPSTITIRGLGYYPPNAPAAPDGTFPTILQINGANNRKERNQDMTIQLVNQGFAVFVIEQRGHGESTGRASFYGEEPWDVHYVLNYIEENYRWVNSTHFGALGFSLGAGCLLIAQALDSRIYATSLFHPPTDIGGIFQQIDIVHITGMSLFQRPSYAPADVDPMEARTAFYWCNNSNTENVLMIQGDADKKVPATDTIRFYESLGIGNRSDVQLIIRPGLDHEPNEADALSRKLAIGWLLRFLGNSTQQASININQLQESVAAIELIPFSPPNRDSLSTLAWFGIAFFEVGLLFYAVVIKESVFSIIIVRIKQIIKRKIQHRIVKHQEQKSQDTEISSSSQKQCTDVPLDSSDPQVIFLQRMVVLALLILPCSILLGIINGFSNPNLLFGLFLELPIITGVLFHFARIYYNKKEHCFPLRVLAPYPFPAPVRTQDEHAITGIMTIGLLTPPLLGMLIYDWAAKMVLLWPANPWKWGLVFYTLALGSLFYVSYAFVEAFMNDKSNQGIFALAFVWILAASQYLLFNPVGAKFGMVTLSLILVFGFGIAMTLMGLMQRALKRIFGKVIVTELLTAEIIGLYILINYMNIL
jgi:alpha-beta hydrolase superfamily lysophospholipase